MPGRGAAQRRPARRARSCQQRSAGLYSSVRDRILSHFPTAVPASRSVAA